MAHNNPTKPPTEEQTIGWFLDPVMKKTYDSVHANCTMNLLEGDLTFAKVVKLYTPTTLVVVAEETATTAYAPPNPPHPHATTSVAQKEREKALADKKVKGKANHLPPEPRTYVPTVVVAITMRAPATNESQTRNQKPQRLTNKPFKTFSSTRPSWNSLNLFSLSSHLSTVKHY
jgi:hypothetical protein